MSLIKNRKQLPELYVNIALLEALLHIIFRGKKWALRVLRWILVVDPEVSDLEELKKCYLMAVSSRKFYLTGLEIGLKRLTEMILKYISVKDEKVVLKLLEGYSEYFKIDPILLGEEIKDSVSLILENLSQFNSFSSCLPDSFVSNLILESSSHYYKSLGIHYKQELCKTFIDVFEYEILNIRNIEDEWFCLWISQDLEQFTLFCKVLQGREGTLKEAIIELGRKRGFHSLSNYKKCASNY